MIISITEKYINQTILNELINIFINSLPLPNQYLTLIITFLKKRCYLWRDIVPQHFFWMKEAHVTKDCHKKAVKLAHKCSIWLEEAEEMAKSAANNIFHWVVYCLHPQKYQVHCVYPTHKLKNYVQMNFNLTISIESKNRKEAT